MNSSTTVAVLAGGQSRRMGGDKSFVLLEGKPLIRHVVDLASQLGYPLMLIANDVARYQPLGLPVYPDAIPGTGALGGLYTALSHSQTQYTLCLACDMPLINVALLGYLTEISTGYDVVVPRVDGIVQGLHAVYHKRCLSLIFEHIQQNRLKINAIFSDLYVRYVDMQEISRFDPDG